MARGVGCSNTRVGDSCTPVSSFSREPNYVRWQNYATRFAGLGPNSGNMMNGASAGMGSTGGTTVQAGRR